MERMSRRSLAISLLLFLLALFPGCGMEGPEGPTMTGNLAGVSYIYDLNVVKAADNSGITVTAEGTGISAVTGADGRWVLSQLPMGTYILTASKAGYGTSKSIGYQFVGGGQSWYGEFSISELPGYRVDGLSATITTDLVSFRGTCTADVRTYPRILREFYGHSANVSSDPGTYASTISHFMGTLPMASFSIPVGISALKSRGFQSGQTVYVVFYTQSAFGNTYPDLSTNRDWFGCLNPTPSNVVSFVLP